MKWLMMLRSTHDLEVLRLKGELDQAHRDASDARRDAQVNEGNCDVLSEEVTSLRAKNDELNVKLLAMSDTLMELSSSRGQEDDQAPIEPFKHDLRPKTRIGKITERALESRKNETAVVVAPR